MEFRACVMVQQRAITIANAANKQDCNNGMILNDDNKIITNIINPLAELI